MHNRQLIGVGMFTLTIGILFWPTLYRYERFTDGGYSVPLRINRVTSHVQMFFRNGGWHDVVKPSDEPGEGSIGSGGRRLPPEERSRVEAVLGGLSGQNRFSASLYNGGSTWVVTHVVVRVVAKERDGKTRWDRRFATDTFALPLAADDFSFEIVDAAGIGSVEWHLEEVMGHRFGGVFEKLYGATQGAQRLKGAPRRSDRPRTPFVGID